MAGNWVYTYEDPGGGRHIVAIERTSRKIVQDSHGSRLVSTFIADSRYYLQRLNILKVDSIYNNPVVSRVNSRTCICSAVEMTIVFLDESKQCSVLVVLLYGS